MSTAPQLPAARLSRLVPSRPDLPLALLALGLAAMQFVDLRIGLHGKPELWSFFLIGFTGLSLLCLPALLRRDALTRAGRVVLASGLVLFGWAFWSASQTILPRILKPWVVIGRHYLFFPLATAVVTMLAAWGLAAAIGGARARQALWLGAVTITATTLLAGPRTMLARHSIRLGTGMGGAAIFHVVLLLCLGILLAAGLRGERRVVSLAGAALCAAGILLTGSRAGLACLLCFITLMVLLYGLRGHARLAGALLGGVAVLLGAVLAFVPGSSRLLTSGDLGRQANLATALQAWQTSWENQVFGIGSGRLWPWYAFETGLAPIPWRGLVQTGFGRAVTNPHSVFLGVLVELGLLGMVPLLVLLGTVLVVAWRRWRALAAERGTAALADVLPLLAVVATIPAFLFDFYLFKNYAVSFWWWLVVALLLGVGGRRGVDPAPSTADHHPTAGEEPA
ncbi:MULTISPECIES: O-antigen ligase family protein [unclassified Luteococcus]|uniref:O-antigen ligase family protein n=1 Tax=unclassified Luteococcus TaxID=2639923 RepID=UPI00313C8D53